jgi:hypothetical protein
MAIGMHRTSPAVSGQTRGVTPLAACGDWCGPG